MNKVPKILLAIETSRSYGRGLLRGIFRYAHIHGPWALVHSPYFYRQSPYFHGGRVRTSDVTPNLTFQYLRNADIDGVIMREERNIEEVKALGIPVIIVSYIKQDPGISHVKTNCTKIGVMAAQHFIERGFKNFAYCGVKRLFWSHIRHDAFKKTVADSGYETHRYEPPRLKKDSIWIREQRYLVEWLKKLPKPIGVFACNDERARDVIEACVLAGLRVPGDVAVLGVNNDDFICEMSDVPLSSITLNLKRPGYEAAELLDEMMKTKKQIYSEILVQPSTIEVRRSTDILAVEDDNVAQAVQYIREHVREPIQVTDVAEAVALSRRSLYEKFQFVLGCSVHQYIKKVRVEEIAKLLTASDMNISEIAFVMGFVSEDHIAQYFRKHKGITPSKYRKQFIH